MDGFTIGQKNNTQKAILHLRYLHPAPNAPVSLNHFSEWCPDRLFDPFLSNDSAIRPATNRVEVAGGFHGANVADFGTAVSDEGS